MRLARTMARGFTLIELMIGMAIFAFLTLLAVPMYGEFLMNTQVRTAAESVLTGVRLAQTEAVRRSVPVRFELVGTTGWQVVFHSDEERKQNCGAAPDCTSDSHIKADCGADSDCVIRDYAFAQGSPKAKLEDITGGTVVTFNGLGMTMAANQDTSAPLQRVTATTAELTAPRKLRVVIGGLKDSKGGTMLCDPAFTSTDPFGCPPTS